MVSSEQPFAVIGRDLAANTAFVQYAILKTRPIANTPLDERAFGVPSQNIFTVSDSHYRETVPFVRFAIVRDQLFFVNTKLFHIPSLVCGEQILTIIGCDHANRILVNGPVFFDL